MKLNDWIIKNRDVVLISIAVLLVIIVIVAGTIKKSPSSVDTFISPFSTDVSTGSGVGMVDMTGVDDDKEVVSLPVYSFEVFPVENVQEIVEQLGMGSVPRTVSDDGIYYLWENGDDFIRYNIKNGDFIVNSAPISLNEAMETNFSSQTAEEYLTEFVREFLSSDLSVNPRSEVQGSFTEVKGSWNIDGYQFIQKYGQADSVIASFDRNGSLVSLYASLVTFTSSDTTVELVSIDELKSYVSFNNYPKEAYIDIVPENTTECGEECDPYGFDGMSSFDNATISEVNIVYYVSTNTENEILPVYQLIGEGTSTTDNGTIPVSVTIYASAIDPSLIIIPSEE